LTLRSVFLAADGRLHAPWRILVFILVTALCGQLLALTVLPLLSGANRLTGMSGTADTIMIVLALIASHGITLYLIDRRTWRYAGLDAEAARIGVLARGWVLGALPILVPSLALMAVGWLAIRPASQGSWLMAATKVSLFLLPAALFEELISRGYIFATLREWLGWPVALLLTSVAFGVMHLGNPGANAQSVIMVTLAGIFLGAVLLATRSLCAAWMAHWSWNWIMAVALHAAVSGTVVPSPDYQVVDAGRDWMTGGPWGPEGGVAAAAGMIATLAYLYVRRPRTALVATTAAPAGDTSETSHDER